MSGIVRIPKPGEIIDERFRLGPEIGRGAFGIVFLAEELDLKRSVAVKLLHPRSLANPQVAERFKREARLVSALSNPHTVKVYAFGEYGAAEDVEGLPYMVMEYLQGEDLHDYLARHGALTLDETISVLLQTLGSIAEAHSRSIIHRDLKPENIFLAQTDDETVVKILDFGIAKAIAEEASDLVNGRNLTAHGMVCGTPQYMAPEQAMGERDLTPAVDVYAIGCIAFELVSGSPPYQGQSPMDIALKHISNPLPDLPEAVEWSPLADIIRCALAKAPEERFTDAQAMRNALLSVAPTHLAPIPTPRVIPPPPMLLPNGAPSEQAHSETPTAIFLQTTPEDHGLPTPPPAPEAPPKRGTALVPAVKPEDVSTPPANPQASLLRWGVLIAGVVLLLVAAIATSLLLIADPEAEATPTGPTLVAPAQPPASSLPAKADTAPQDPVLARKEPEAHDDEAPSHELPDAELPDAEAPDAEAPDAEPLPAEPPPADAAAQEEPPDAPPVAARRARRAARRTVRRRQATPPKDTSKIELWKH